MNCEFITSDMPMPSCMLFPKVLVALSISNTAKIMYCLILDTVLKTGIKDENGTLFVYFPLTELVADISKCIMPVGRYLNDLEKVGLIMRIRQEFGKPNRIYVLGASVLTELNEKHSKIKCLRLEGSNFRLGGIAPITRAVPSFRVPMRLAVSVAWQKGN